MTNETLTPKNFSLKVWVGGGSLVLVLLLGIGFLVYSSICPCATSPGGFLYGERVDAPVADWNLTTAACVLTTSMIPVQNARNASIGSNPCNARGSFSTTGSIPTQRGTPTLSIASQSRSAGCFTHVMWCIIVESSM